MFFRDIALHWIPSRRQAFDAALLEPVSRDRFLDFTFVIAIIGILMAIAAQNLYHFAIKVQMLEAVSLIGTHRANAVAYRAATGRLPTETMFDDTSSQKLGKNFSRVNWHNQELVLTLSERAIERFGYRQTDTIPTEKKLSLGFRVAIAPVSGNMVWLCGSQDPPAGFQGPAAERTNVPDRFLPHFCRASETD